MEEATVAPAAVAVVTPVPVDVDAGKDGLPPIPRRDRTRSRMLTMRGFTSRAGERLLWIPGEYLGMQRSDPKDGVRTC